MELSIRHAEERDKEVIISLLNASFSNGQRTSQQRGSDYWNWKFQNNPFGCSILTVTETSDRIVAVNNLWPWEFNIRGSVYRALQPCDSVVHTDFRGMGIFKKMRAYGLEFARSNDYKFLYNFPNENSLPTYLSLGWHFQGKIVWWIKIFKPIRVIKEVFYPEKTESFYLDREFDIDLNIINQLIVENQSFDGLIKTNRIPGFHEWRYRDHPYRSYGMIYYEKGKKSIAAVFTINKNTEIREMIVVDIIGDMGSTTSLLKLVVKAGEKMNVGFIAVMNNPVLNSLSLWKYGFFKYKFKNMVVMPLDISFEGIVKSYGNWSLMANLHDSI
jgi:GNAT superfamily N-acetyltransferase